MHPNLLIGAKRMFGGIAGKLDQSKGVWSARGVQREGVAAE